jgi:glycosyltransferase involved in cell wall biosynthesis
MKKILITSPSLENVSGISSLVSDILSHSKSKLMHFIIGSRDGTKKNIKWLVSQFVMYVHFIWLSIFKKYDILHLNMTMLPISIFRDVVIALLAKKLLNKKVILHIHGGYYLMNPPGNRVLFSLIKLFFKASDAIIVLSPLEEEVLTQLYGNHNYYVFPNAVDTRLFKEINKSAYSAQEKRRFIFLGSIKKIKGIYTISESFQYLKDYFDSFVLDIYGSGPDLEEWEESLSKFPALQYTYKGVIKGKEKAEALSNADVFLLPSIHGEGLPIAMLEAMAAGCVVIVTDDASITSVVTNHVNGIVIPKNHPEQLAEQIKNIIDGKVDVQKMGNNAMRHVHDYLSFSSYADKLDELYAVI